MFKTLHGLALPYLPGECQLVPHINCRHIHVLCCGHEPYWTTGHLLLPVDVKLCDPIVTHGPYLSALEIKGL